MTQNIEKWEETLEELLDKNFPKNKCKERGRALVFYAEVTMLIRILLHNNLKKEREKWIIGSVLPHLREQNGSQTANRHFSGCFKEIDPYDNK